MADALRAMKMIEKKAGWVFRGPQATREVLEGIVSTGFEPPAYAAHYLGTCGVSPRSGIAQEFRHVIAILWLVICHDRLHPLNLASSEYYMARRLLMIQCAIKRNPSSSDC